jgi:hypothetical protein
MSKQKERRVLIDATSRKSRRDQIQQGSTSTAPALIPRLRPKVLVAAGSFCDVLETTGSAGLQRLCGLGAQSCIDSI